MLEKFRKYAGVAPLVAAASLPLQTEAANTTPVRSESLPSTVTLSKELHVMEALATRLGQLFTEEFKNELEERECDTIEVIFAKEAHGGVVYLNFGSKEQQEGREVFVIKHTTSVSVDPQMLLNKYAVEALVRGVVDKEFSE